MGVWDLLAGWIWMARFVMKSGWIINKNYRCNALVVSAKTSRNTSTVEWDVICRPPASDPERVSDLQERYWGPIQILEVPGGPVCTRMRDQGPNINVSCIYGQGMHVRKRHACTEKACMREEEFILGEFYSCHAPSRYPSHGPAHHTIR